MNNTIIYPEKIKQTGLFNFLNFHIFRFPTG